MSGDLISRKELFEEINCYHYDTVSSEVRRAEHFVKAHICELIDKQPIAYNIEGAIRQINDAIMPTPEHRHKFCETVEPEHCVKYDNCEDCMAERMIEIVKSGGIEEEKGERE